MDFLLDNNSILKMEKNEKYIREIYRLVKTDSILIIDRYGKLRRLYCPFKVIVIRIVPNLKTGEIAYVEAVKMTITLEDVYIIGGKAYFIWNFKILL